MGRLGGGRGREPYRSRSHCVTLCHECIHAFKIQDSVAAQAVHKRAKFGVLANFQAVIFTITLIHEQVTDLIPPPKYKECERVHPS